MSPIDAIGDGWLLSAHMGQHLMLSDVGPALLVLGLRAPMLPLGLTRARPAVGGARAAAAGRVIAVADERVGRAATVGRGDWLWAIPCVFDYSAAHPVVHAVEHLTLFYTGLALWWLIVDPLPSARRAPNGAPARLPRLLAPRERGRLRAARS